LTFLQALEKYNIEKDIAAYIKKEFDKKYNPTWHCIVGRNFGSYVTHETRLVLGRGKFDYVKLILFPGISSTSTWGRLLSCCLRVDKPSIRLPHILSYLVLIQFQYLWL
jgi:hypothetical protein